MKYPLSELIDFPELHGLMTAFHRATGINHALLDTSGKVLTSVGWQPVCSRFHHRSERSNQRCLLHNATLWNRPSQTPYFGHRCGNGLYDYATPVLIAGEHVANIFIGQILHSPPSHHRFHEQAEECGFDVGEYLEAIDQITVLPRERLADIMAFLVCLAQILGAHGHTRLRQLEAEEKLQQMNKLLARRIQQRTAELSESNRLLRLKEEKLQQSHDLLTKLSDQVPGVLFQYKVSSTGHACFPFTNQAMQDIYEVTPEQVREDASLLSAFHHPDDAEGIAASLRESARSLKPWHYEFRVMLPRQGLRWRLGNARPERLADGSTLWHGFITDITERKALEQELERQACQDPLTGLANRRHFMNLAEGELARTLRYQHSMAILMIDIDHFKEVNDTYGHKIGDLILQRVGKIFQDSLRAVDIVGRLGGEEFAIILPMTDGLQAQDVAERLRQSVAHGPLQLDQGLPVRFTVSIGVAQLKASDTNLDTLLHQADQALYEAKRSGRNRVCAYAAQDEPEPADTPAPPAHTHEK